MDGTIEYYAKRSQSVRERQIPYDYTRMWNLRNKTNEQRGEKERQWGKPRNRLLTTENKLMVTREVVGGTGEIGDGD